MTRARILALLIGMLCGPLALMLSLSLTPDALAQDASPEASDTRSVAERFVDAMNTVFTTGDAAALDEIVAAGYIDRTPSMTRTGGEQTPDLAGLKNTFVAVHDVFPDATVRIDQAIVEGDMAALLVTFAGMRGQDTTTDGVLILRVADGKVVESWNYESGGEQRMQPMFEATPEA
jgi:predicted SnoaL-like aldol condensation-catalyzing enzyme